MRAAVLSDDQVIKVVNEFFIPLEINVTTDGFPSEIPAMKIVEKIYQSNWRNEFGFASCLVVDPTGRIPLGTSAAGADIKTRLDPELNFSPKRYLEFMVTALERFKKMQQINQLPLFQRLSGWKDFLAELTGDVHKEVQTLARIQASMPQ